MMTTSDRQPRNRSRSQFTGRNVTNYPTCWIQGLVATLTLLGASIQARAQEPVLEPEPVVEAAAGQPEVVPEPEVAPEPEVESSSAQPVVDPPSRVARIGYVDGEATVAPAGTDEWAEAVLNRPLTSGDRVWVESGGRAELQIGSAAVYLDGDTGFGFIELDDGVLQASLTEGAATLRVRRLAEGETIQVETPHATVVLNHVGEYHLEVDKAGDRTIVKTRSGEAQVKGGSETFTVRDNERGVFAGLENLSERIERLDARTAFENWANERDARNERSQSAKYVSRDVIGYEDLDDNGEWLSEPEYGHVWRPRHVAYDWAPYRYGRWAYVSPWGWSWIDDARWGFAPSHYGRWAHIRDRWCWVPGPRHLRPVYAPALVGWVGGPRVGASVSFGSGVGWYPLGPRDVFYPGYRHTPRYVRYAHADLGHHSAAVANREVARSLGQHAGHPEIGAWATEVAAWQAILACRYRDAVRLCRTGREPVATGTSAHTQLVAQEARALARLGQADEVHGLLDQLHTAVDRMDTPERPDHHFVFDPRKHVGYTATTLAWLGDAERGETWARQAVDQYEEDARHGRSVRRLATARIDLALILAEADEPDEAAYLGTLALASGRLVPSNIWRARELDQALDRFPVVAEVSAFHDLYVDTQEAVAWQGANSKTWPESAYVASNERLVPQHPGT